MTNLQCTKHTPNNILHISTIYQFDFSSILVVDNDTLKITKID